MRSWIHYPGLTSSSPVTAAQVLMSMGVGVLSTPSRVQETFRCGGGCSGRPQRPVRGRPSIHCNCPGLLARAQLWCSFLGGCPLGAVSFT